MPIFATIVLLNLIKYRFHLCYCGYTILRKVSLATIGVCVFVRLLRWAHFFIRILRRWKNGFL